MVGDLQRGYPGLTLRTTGADQEIPLNCSGLEIVLGHLLGNAAQHGASRVDLNVTGEDGAVVLTVSDDGNGMRVLLVRLSGGGGFRLAARR